MKQKAKTKLKTGDLVEIISGKDKGKRGKLIRVLLKDGRGVVEGANLVKQHVKPTQKNPQGGIVTREASIHLSNLMIVDPKTDKPVRSAKTPEAKGGR